MHACMHARQTQACMHDRHNTMTIARPVELTTCPHLSMQGHKNAKQIKVSYRIFKHCFVQLPETFTKHLIRAVFLNGRYFLLLALWGWRQTFTSFLCRLIVIVGILLKHCKCCKLLLNNELAITRLRVLTRWLLLTRRKKEN